MTPSVAILALLLSPTLEPARAGEAERPARICYFSMNNRKESVQAARFVTKVNEYSEQKFEVRELFDPTEEADPNVALEKACASGLACEGFVLSGHHVDDWFGDSVSEHLTHDTIAKLSCDPKCRDFFENVRAFWTQGCNTLEDPDEKDVNAAADIRMRQRYRQGAGHELRLAQMQRSFIATRNGSNPLSTQWKRAFPRATIFGWTDSAPGVGEHSENSIPWHMAHILKVRQHGSWASDPLKEKLTAHEALQYAQALELTLKIFGGENPTCDEEARKGWISHGHHKVNTKEPGYNVHAIDAYAPLSLNPDPLLTRLRESFCQMTFGNRAAILTAIDTILEHEDGIGYSFAGVWNLIQRLQESTDPKDKETLRLVLERLNTPPDAQHLPYVHSYMRKNLADPDMPLLGKLDFYGFYKVITLQNEPAMEKVLIRDALRDLLKAAPAKQLTDFWDYKVEIFKSLKANGLIDSEEFSQRMVESIGKDRLEPSVVGSLIFALEHLLSKGEGSAADLEAKVLLLAKNKGMKGFTYALMFDLFEKHASRFKDPGAIYYELARGEVGDLDNPKIAEVYDFLVRSIAVIDKAKLPADKRDAVARHLQSVGESALTDTRTKTQADFDLKERIAQVLFHPSVMSPGYPEALAKKLLGRKPTEFELRLALYAIEYSVQTPEGQKEADTLLHQVATHPNATLRTAYDIGRVVSVKNWDRFTDPEGALLGFMPAYRKTPMGASTRDFLNAVKRLPKDKASKLKKELGQDYLDRLVKIETNAKPGPSNYADFVRMSELVLSGDFLSREVAHDFIVAQTKKDSSDLQFDQAVTLLNFESFQRNHSPANKASLYQDLNTLIKDPRLSPELKKLLEARLEELLHPPVLALPPGQRVMGGGLGRGINPAVDCGEFDSFCGPAW